MRVVLVGCGHIADTHLRLLRNIRGVTVPAVCDLDIDRAREVAKRHRVHNFYDNTRAMLEAVDPTVVHVLTPPQSHGRVVSEILGRGRTALVEKPLAVDSREARHMIRIAAESGTQLSVCHNYLFMQAVRRALRLVNEGTLGEIASADLYWRATSLEGETRDVSDWARQLTGGEFHEIAPHAVYLLEAFLGRLEVVSVQTSELEGSANELRVLLRGEAAPAALTISLRGQPIQKHLRINGSRMSLHIDLATNVLLRLRPWGSRAVGRALNNFDQSAQLTAGTTGNVMRSLVGRMPRTHLEFFRAFYHALGQGDPPPVTGERGLTTVETLDQVWRISGHRTA
jgi:predicted dehydrogenase